MNKIARPVRSDLESDILARIRKAIAAMPDVRVFRNNVGVLKDATGRRVTYGLGVGSADLIGSVTVTRNGSPPFARAVAIEVKRPGEKPSEEQARWLAMAREAGWIVGIATSPEEAIDLIERGRRWEI